MFVFNIGLSRLINKLSLISNKNILVPWAKMLKSSNEKSWLQNRRWSRIKLSTDGLTLLKVNEEMPMVSTRVLIVFYLLYINLPWFIL